MIRTSSFPGIVNSDPAERDSFPWDNAVRILALVALLLVVGVAAVAGLALVQAPPGLQVSLAEDARDVPLDAKVRLEPGGWFARVDGVTLSETPLSRGGSTEVPTRLDLVREGWQHGETEAFVQPGSGPLRPDTAYRLVVRGSALEAALPWPRMTEYERVVQFTTPSSPRALPAAGSKQLSWEEPLAIRWNMPIEEFRYQVTPGAATRAWVNPGDRAEAFVVIEQPAEATTYQISMTAATGLNGIVLQQPTTYTAVTPVRPRLLEAEQTLPVENAKPLTLHWNVPVERLSVAVSPEAAVIAQPDPADPTVTHLQIEGLAQGATYELTVLEAATRSGAPLAASPKLNLVVAPPLEIAEFQLGSEARLVSTAVRPVVTFSEEVRDRRAAESAISVLPTVAGRFEWLDERQLRFVPSRGFPYDSEITFRVRPGPDGAQSVAGGYLQEGFEHSFLTVPNKTIDVDVTRQVMRLIEGERTVRTLTIATGLPGADTPLGQFRVQYKMRNAHFRGVNSASGLRYDLPNVNWVLAFMGDYTIHGAYWRQQFGQPGSNGCVSLSDPDAKLVYDWAPEGTLIRIHY